MIFIRRNKKAAPKGGSGNALDLLLATAQEPEADSTQTS
jgi:hypothetical protein